MIDLAEFQSISPYTDAEASEALGILAEECSEEHQDNRRVPVACHAEVCQVGAEEYSNWFHI